MNVYVYKNFNDKRIRNQTYFQITHFKLNVNYNYFKIQSLNIIIF